MSGRYFLLGLAAGLCITGGMPPLRTPAGGPPAAGGAIQPAAPAPASGTSRDMAAKKGDLTHCP